PQAAHRWLSPGPAQCRPVRVTGAPHGAPGGSIEREPPYTSPSRSGPFRRPQAYAYTEAIVGWSTFTFAPVAPPRRATTSCWPNQALPHQNRPEVNARTAPTAPARRTGAAAYECRTSNSANPCGSFSCTSTPETSALAGPCSSQRATSRTGPSSPSSQASTRPSGRLRTQPCTPSDTACSTVLCRYQTPCTLPLTSACNAIFMTPPAMP